MKSNLELSFWLNENLGKMFLQREGLLVFWNDKGMPRNTGKLSRHWSVQQLLHFMYCRLCTLQSFMSQTEEVVSTLST